MKVNLNLNRLNTNYKINFTGYKPVKSEYGDREYEFNYVYDDSKYDCYLELYSVEKDNNGNFYVTDILDNYNSDDYSEQGIKLNSGKATRIDLATDFDIAPDEAFAYHYKLYPKDTKDSPMYLLDPGTMIDETSKTHQAYDKYNIVSDRSSTSTKGGAMKLIVPDNYNIIWEYDKNNKIQKKSQEEINKALHSSKNFANKIGGSLAGIEKDLDDGKFKNFSRIITTPIFTDDSLSSHGYWTKNCFQMAQSLGNINNYTSIQKKMFAQGINLVSDAAYVNEGLEGVHFKNILKWGDKSPYFNWFNITGLQDSPLSLGVFGKKIEHVTHRLVNSPYEFKENDNGTVSIKSIKYDKNRPTYIQVYDDRLVDTKNLSDKDIIKEYDKFDDNYLDINTHNDTIIPYSFPINPETYKKNVEALNKYNKNISEEKRISLKSGIGTRTVAQFEYFNLDGKHEGGFYTWDANPDIAKLRYALSHADTQALKNIQDPDERSEKLDELKRTTYQVQDYAVSSAKYWTKKTNQILNLNVAQHLRNINNKDADEILYIIQNKQDGKILPKKLDVNIDIVENVLDNKYNLKEEESIKSYKDSILKGLMDVPLDSIEVGDDIIGVLASPYISKRANSEDLIGVPRYEAIQRKKLQLSPEYQKTFEATNKMYSQDMARLATEILKGIDDKLPKDNKLHDEYGNITPYGKYVIPLLTAEIAKFAIIKGVAPKTDFSYDDKTGEISYDYNKLKKTSLMGMGIIGDSPKDEANKLINKLSSRIKKINATDKEKLTKALWQSIKGTDVDSFKLAEMIVDRSEAGLDWRIDATKDICDIESVRNKKTDFEYTWNTITNFWQKFSDNIKEYHPDAYITAEVTDESDIYNVGYGSKSGSRYGSVQEAVKKLINEAGFTSLANYTNFSSSLTSIFGKLFAIEGGGVEKGTDKGLEILNQLAGEGNFLHSGPLESIIYSYTFAGNHDKCRAIEGYAMDMDLVYSDLTNPENYEYRQRAYKILNGMGFGDNPTDGAVNGFNYDRVSSLAVAKSESIISGMGKAKEAIGLSQEKKDYVYGMLLKALKNLSNGYYKDKVIEADGFGAKDYNIALDIVFKEMDYLEHDSDKRLTNEEKKRLKDATLEKILDPAMSKLLGQTKFLTALVGNPTLYAGDEVGSTGYETTTKNIYLHNRNVIHNEWADSESEFYKDFIKRNKDFMDYQYNLRARPELQPLNDGTPFALKPQEAHYKTSIYRDQFDHSKGVDRYEEGNSKMSALLRQSPNGAMTVSVFNTSGLNHNYDGYYEPGEISMDCIDLNEGYGGNAGLRAGLNPGLKFKNADRNDHTTYYVNGNNQITGPDNRPINFKDTVLILYHTPEGSNQPSFTGNRVLYNPQYNIVSNPYANVIQKEISVGNKLALISK